MSEPQVVIVNRPPSGRKRTGGGYIGRSKRWDGSPRRYPKRKTGSLSAGQTMTIQRVGEPPLSPQERSELTGCEAVIERGIQTFKEVGAALVRIREGRLYRASHKTFEAYCQERWEFTRRYANRMIAAAVVVENLGTIGPILPATESQARPLVKLEPEQQREVWAAAVETAPNGKVTAAHVEQVVERYSPASPPPEKPQRREYGTKIIGRDGLPADPEAAAPGGSRLSPAEEAALRFRDHLVVELFQRYPQLSWQEWSVISEQLQQRLGAVLHCYHVERKQPDELQHAPEGDNS